MKNRSELREVIMKVIYQVNLLEDTNLDYDLGDLIKEQLEIKNDFVNSSVDGIIEHKKEIYELANKYLNKWTIERLNKVDQAILALGIYELMYTDTPSIVAIILTSLIYPERIIPNNPPAILPLIVVLSTEMRYTSSDAFVNVFISSLL